MSFLCTSGKLKSERNENKGIIVPIFFHHLVTFLYFFRLPVSLLLLFKFFNFSLAITVCLIILFSGFVFLIKFPFYFVLLQFQLGYMFSLFRFLDIFFHFPLLFRVLFSISFSSYSLYSICLSI